MTPAEIINKSLLDTHTSSANYELATVWIEALNIVSDYINNEVVQNVRENYFWNEFKVDSVINQSEYNISTAWMTWDSTPDVSVNLKKVNKVFIKYADTDTYYTRMDIVNPDLLEKDTAEYAASQSKAKPFFYIQDRSIFLFPAPDVAVSQGIQMNAIYSPPEITLTSNETWLPLQKDKHYIYSLGMEWQIYKSQGKLNEANNAKQIFEQELIKVMKYLKSRSNTPIKKTISWLDNFR